MSFSLHFPCWDFCIFNWILFVCEYWKYEQGKEGTENQTVRIFMIEEDNVYKALMSYDMNPYKRTITTLLSYDMGLYSRTTWDHNKALLLFFDAKSCKMRIVFMLKSISWELYRQKTSKQNPEGNIYNKERLSFLSYSILSWLLGLIQASIKTNH